jgi:RNA-directed DNA polymerase
MVDTALFERWKEQLQHRKDTKQSFSSKPTALIKKRYLHLDFPVSDEELEHWKSALLNPEIVRQRSFYPFLKVVKLRKKFAKDPHGMRRPAKPKERAICYAAHHDALFFSWYGFMLETRLEPQLLARGLDDCVLAYRAKGRNNLHFSKEVFDYIAAQPTCVALAFDVSKFFDTLDHRLLKQGWTQLLQESELPKDHYTVFKAMTQFRYLTADAVKKELGKEGYKQARQRRRLFFPDQFREKLRKEQETNREKYGIPQGSPMSAVLSNIYMLPLDAALQAFAQRYGGIYRRYCDDLLFVLPIGLEGIAEALVREQLDALKLEMNKKKTERRFFTRSASGKLECRDECGQVLPLQYLGLEYDGETILLRSSSLSRYHERMRRSIRKAIYRAQGPKGEKGGKVYRRALYSKFTDMGTSNFVTYAERAYEVTGSKALQKQVSGSVQRVNQVIQEELKRYASRLTHARSSGQLPA